MSAEYTSQNVSIIHNPGADYNTSIPKHERINCKLSHFPPDGMTRDPDAAGTAHAEITVFLRCFLSVSIAVPGR